MIVVSDTSAICYLLLVEQINLLPQLYGAIAIPQAVEDELLAAAIARSSPNLDKATA